MTFSDNRFASTCIGAAALIGSFAWFFLSQDRNVPDSDLGMNGNEQFAYFSVGSGTGLAITLILASLRQLKFGAQKGEFPEGLDALRETTFLSLMFRLIRRRGASGSTLH